VFGSDPFVLESDPARPCTSSEQQMTFSQWTGDDQAVDHWMKSPPQVLQVSHDFGVLDDFGQVMMDV